MATAPAQQQDLEQLGDVEQVTLAEAVAAFLAERDLAESTRAKYRATLDALVLDVGDELPVVDIDGRHHISPFLAARWAEAAPSTWNRHRAAVSSFLAYCVRQRWRSDNPAEATERRRELVDHTRARPFAELDALWSRRTVPLRERALWRLLYESAARADEVLGLDVSDVDLPNRQAVVVGKGGDVEIIHFQTGAARLLARLIGDRQAGPVFLASRRPSPARAPALADLDPTSGRARLSYRRAEELFKRWSGGLTLHQLRHSNLTDLAEANVGLPLLQAKSRHSSYRSLQRYARPGPAAVAAMTAATDPLRRRRRALR